MGRGLTLLREFDVLLNCVKQRTILRKLVPEERRTRQNDSKFAKMDEMTKNDRNRQVREQTNTQYGTRPTFRSPIQSEFHVIWVILI